MMHHQTYNMDYPSCHMIFAKYNTPDAFLMINHFGNVKY